MVDHFQFDRIHSSLFFVFYLAALNFNLFLFHVSHWLLEVTLGRYRLIVNPLSGCLVKFQLFNYL